MNLKFTAKAVLCLYQGTTLEPGSPASLLAGVVGRAEQVFNKAGFSLCAQRAVRSTATVEATGFRPWTRGPRLKEL